MPLSKYHRRTLEQFMAVMAPAARELSSKSACCIWLTAVTIDVLTKLHFKARPLCVEVDIYNPVCVEKYNCRAPIDEAEAHAMREAGCWSITLGDRTLEIPRHWPGHLVCVVNETAMFDMSLSQANRPQHNIDLEPLVLDDLPASFLTGDGDHGGTRVNGCALDYLSHPNDRTFERTADWRLRGNNATHRDLVRDALEAMRKINSPKFLKRFTP